MSQKWEVETTHYRNTADHVLQAAKTQGTQAEVYLSSTIGFHVDVRQQEIETLAYHQATAAVITVYLGHQKGEASTTDLRPHALKETVAAAYRIAKLTQADEFNGLADPSYLAQDYPSLDLHHPWEITPAEAAEKAKQCEAQGLSFDKRITQSEGVSLSTGEGFTLYANTNGFEGHYLTSMHTIDCALVARDKKGNMQRDGSRTISREASALQSIEWLAKEAAEKTVRRLDARRIKTQKAPVIFEAEVANELIRCFLSAITGSTLYQKASFLLDQCQKPVFSKHIHIENCPHELKGLASEPFDGEGVATKRRYLVQDGVLQSYLLGSYAARRLNLETTGNAGGYHNIKLSTHEPDLKALLANMQRGLLVTEVIGHGINLVTGDYSQGVAGFWVENGEIQYPVEEITIAGNLKEMFRNVIAISGDINQQSSIQTGSIFIESMMIAGE